MNERVIPLVVNLNVGVSQELDVQFLTGLLAFTKHYETRQLSRADILRCLRYMHDRTLNGSSYSVPPERRGLGDELP